MRCDTLLRSRIIDELAWHTDKPAAAYELLTEAERKDIMKRGFVTRTVWDAVSSRMKEEVHG